MSPLSRRTVSILVLLTALSAAARAAAQEQPAPDKMEVEAADGAPARTGAVPRPATADDEEARRRAYSLGMVLIGLVLICGVALLALVLLWGSRARRIAREPLPRISPHDELWFLKRKKDMAAPSDSAEDEGDG
jgi:hypothetical protein